MGKKQKQSLISSALFEFYFTRNQNVHPTNSVVLPFGQWPVDYFNHSAYISGYTYKGNVMGVPLFSSVVYDKAGKVIGLANTRLYAFHGGIGGRILPRDHYKMMLTYSVNSGIWNSYPNKLKRFSTLFEYSDLWTRDFVINVGLAYDFTNQGVDIKPDDAHQGSDNGQIRGTCFGFCWKIMP